MSAEFAHHRKAVGFGVTLDGVADIAQPGARLHLRNAQPQAFIGDAAQAGSLLGGFATDHEHAAGVAVEAVLDDRDVQIDDVALLQCPLRRHAVAHHVIDRGADRLRIGAVAGRRVVQRRRDGLLHVHHVVMAQAVEFRGGHARLDMGPDVVEHFRGQSARHAHAFDFFRCLDGDAHEKGLFLGIPRDRRLAEAVPPGKRPSSA